MNKDFYTNYQQGENRQNAAENKKSHNIMADVRNLYEKVTCIVPIITFLAFVVFVSLNFLKMRDDFLKRVSEQQAAATELSKYLPKEGEVLTEEERAEYIDKAKELGFLQYSKMGVASVQTWGGIDIVEKSTLQGWIKHNIDEPSEAITWRYNNKNYTTEAEIKVLYNEIESLREKIIESPIIYDLVLKCANPAFDVIKIEAYYNKTVEASDDDDGYDD
jgi:hypothetical protein